MGNGNSTKRAKSKKPKPLKRLSTLFRKSAKEEGLADYEDGAIETDDQSCSTQIRNITVSIVKGDIAQQKADVIVCGVPGDVDPNKTVIKRALLKKAGIRLQKDCKEKYPSGIKIGEIASTCSGNLKCKRVYHVCLPSKENSDKDTVLSKCIYKCLEKASDENRGSIAFPALGTGVMGIRINRVAKLFFEAIESFARDTDSSLTNITCVIFQDLPMDIKTFAGEFRERRLDSTAVPELLYSRDVAQLSQPYVDVEATPETLSSVQFGQITVNLIVGSLTDQQCGILVGTCTRELELSKSAIGMAILDVAGPALQTQCSSNYPHGIQHGEVAVLSPPDMSCSCIYLVALPRYNSDNQTTVLKSLVIDCLHQAIKDRQFTISFPTLGTGYLRYPPEISAEAMLQAVSDFNTKNHSATMTMNIILHADGPDLQKKQRPFLETFEQCLASSRPSRAESVIALPVRYTPAFCECMYSILIHYPPEYWTHFTCMRSIKDWQIESRDQHYILVDLEEDQGEFQTVENLVHNSWMEEHKGHGRDARGLAELDFNEINVTRVQRVENVSLYEKYVTRRAELFLKAAKRGMLPKLVENEDLKHGKVLTEHILRCLESSWLETLYGEVNECYLFHGTKADNIENLFKQGIDVRMAQGGAVFGPAVYMAESSTKTDQYTDERGNRKTNGLQMLLCRACLGEMKVMRTTKKFRRPPCKEGCEGYKCSHDRYDSIVAEGIYRFREFIVYDNNQVYPEYIITYDRAKTVGSDE